MAAESPLFLHEEIMLLALKTRRGTFKPMLENTYAIGAALLAELLLNRRITVDEPHRKRMVEVRMKKPPGDPLLNECLKRIGAAGRRASLRTWAARFAGLKDLELRVADRLARRGLIEADAETLPLILRGKLPPRVEPGPEKALYRRLREAVTASAENLDPRSAVLLSLAFNAGLLKVPFNRQKLLARQARITRIIEGELIGESAKEKAQAAQAALVVACIMPAVFFAIVS